MRTMHWFEATAPIRLKLMVAFGTLTGLTAAATVAGAFSHNWIIIGVGAAATAVSALLGLKFRESITRPYITSVERMEALAAGDVTSPINYTDYQDCVGRMAQAMLAFRDAGQGQQGVDEEQKFVVSTMASSLSNLAAGDLTAEITSDFPAAYAELKTNFNGAVVSLREVIGSVMECTSTIGTGSTEIAAASEDLARRTEANAANLEETSAAVTQMDERLKATAVAAGQTVTRADAAIATVADGRSVADQAMQAMERVSESAKGIDDVIEGLDKIAFQTRVLAMNAAVEAGRAGDAGRGFAVVADLVSALAMRAEEEAKRARDQLSVTQADIGTAVQAVQKVDGALADISTGVGEVHQLLGRIAADNQAQSSAVTQISAAIGTMDHSTQQNAAMVEETSAAARNLTNEATTLSDRAARFTIGKKAVKAPIMAPAAPKRAASKGSVAKVPVATIAQAASVAAAASAASDDWASF
jgi:methyl-accepting chemotaxis protein